MEFYDDDGRYSEHEDLPHGYIKNGGPPPPPPLNDDGESWNEISTMNPPTTLRGKLVTFYRNGDSHFKGLKTSVSSKSFATFETLLVWLNEKVPTAAGVRYVFSLSEGREIKDIADFEPGRSYIVSSVRKIAQIPYGTSQERYWKNKGFSAGKVRKIDTDLFNHGKVKKTRSYPGSVTPRKDSLQSSMGGGGVSPLSVRPRILTIVSNTNRDSKEKVILNPQTTQTYEEMLEDITGMIQMDNPPMSALWTAKKPFKKVRGFTHLLRDLKSHAAFLACGQEMKPLELMNHYDSDQLPQVDNHSSSDSASGGYVSRPLRKVTQTQSEPSLVSVGRPGVPSEKGLASSSTDSSGPGLQRSPKSQRRKPAQRTRRDSRYPDGSLAEEDERLDGKPVTQGAPRRAARIRPYRRVYPEADVVQVNIHGNTREFYAPRYTQSEPDGSKPEKRLKLDWVYGYRGRDARNNLHILPGGELLYYVAAVAVMYDRKTDKQTHYTEHNEDITCMAVHPDRVQPCVATGQLGGKYKGSEAHVRVWDPLSLSTYNRIGNGVFQGAVSSVGFSGNTGENGSPGDLLLAIDEGETHVLSIWDWQHNQLIAKTTSITRTHTLYHNRRQQTPWYGVASTLTITPILSRSESSICTSGNCSGTPARTRMGGSSGIRRAGILSQVKCLNL